MWARIENGTVAEITDKDPKGRFHPSLHWEPAGESIDVGDLFSDGKFSKPVTPIGDLAGQAKARIESAYDAALAAGMPYTMPDGSDDVVQTRAEDEPNLLGLAIEARDLKAGGVTGAVLELRTLSNTIYQLTPAQMIEITDAAKTFKKQLLGRSWHRKDTIAAALESGDREALESIDW